MAMVRVVHYGLGPIGCAIARLVASRPGLQIAGAVDVDPEKAGRDVGAVVGLGRDLGVAVSADARGTLAAVKPDLVIHSTRSSLPDISPQLVEAMEAGADVVSTCEELAYPPAHNRQLGEGLDRVARANGVTVLGTGINPGFAMDALALALTAPCATVERVRVRREVDASKRRLPLQRKVGAGLTVEAFRAGVKAGTIRHVGLLESLHMVAGGLGWSLDEAREAIEPVVAGAAVRTEHLSVEAGQVAGVYQRAAGVVGGREVLVLELRMAVGASAPHDAVEIDGDPPVRMRIEGGLFGDTGTAAVVVNAIPRVLRHAPGLVTMRDLPLVHAWSGSLE